MSGEEPHVLKEMDRRDRHRTRRERLLAAAILVIGVFLALALGYVITDVDEGIRSIKCEEGDVTLIVERADGGLERVVCPAGAVVQP